jgi:hypothetical protein
VAICPVCTGCCAALHSNNFNEGFLLIISTKTVPLARFRRMVPDDGPNGPKHVEAI